MSESGTKMYGQSVESKQDVQNGFVPELCKNGLEYAAQGVSSHGRGSLQGLMWLNGGAAIALLTFVGNYSVDSHLHPMLVSAIGLFAIGAFLSVVSSAFSYSADYNAYSLYQVVWAAHSHDGSDEKVLMKCRKDYDNFRQISDRCRICAVWIAVVSGLLFVAGVILGVIAIQTQVF